MTNKLWQWAFWALVLATVWLSLTPAEHIPSTLHFWDKAQHALGFAGLALCGLMAYAGRRGRVLLGLVVLGMAIEVLQHLSGWRYGDVLDWLADGVGLAIGYAVWRAAQRWMDPR